MGEGSRAWLQALLLQSLYGCPYSQGLPSHRCPAELAGRGLPRVLGKPWLLFLEKTEWRTRFQKSKYRPPSGSLLIWAKPTVGEGSRPIFFFSCKYFPLERKLVLLFEHNGLSFKREAFP